MNLTVGLWAGRLVGQSVSQSVRGSFVSFSNQSVRRGLRRARL